MGKRILPITTLVTVVLEESLVGPLALVLLRTRSTIKKRLTVTVHPRSLVLFYTVNHHIKMDIQ